VTTCLHFILKKSGILYNNSKYHFESTNKDTTISVEDNLQQERKM